MKKKLYLFVLIISLVANGLFVFDKFNNDESEILIGNEELLGEDNNFGTTVAIYVEQNEGKGDYIQKNNVPTENVYVVNSRTHCVGGGYIGYNNFTHKLSYLFDQADECYVYLDKVNALLLTTQIENAYIESLSSTEPTIQQINYDATNTVITSGNAAYTEYRYISKTPDNYVWFNCDINDGSLASQTYEWYNNHCEKWRIIGIMDTNTTGESQPLVKIIRDSLGNISWDYKKNKNGSSISDNGSNDWSDAQLMMMMNPAKYLNQGYRVNSSVLTNTKDIHGREYFVDTETGKVYYASGTDTTQSVMQMTYNNNTEEWAGAYYNRANGCKPGATAAGEEYTCNEADFSTTGLRDEAKKYIQVLNWKIEGHSTSAVTTESMYKYERGTSVVNTNRPTTWYGEIGLMYPTDWAMATDLGKIATGETLCKDTNLNGWDSYEDCYNNWLYTNNWTWTISPNPSSYHYAFYVGHYLVNYFPSVVHAVRPVLYLKAGTMVTGGIGTSNDPYQLMM